MSDQSYFVIDEKAAQQADDKFFALHPELDGREPGFSPEDAKLSREWLDLYVSFGGKVNEIGNSGVRVAPIVLNDPLTGKVDELFYKKFPELNGRKLTFSPGDGKLRCAWMDLYVELGGEVIEIASTGIRIPRSVPAKIV